VSLLAYSPLGFGLLTGKYDATGIASPEAPQGRMAKFESMKKQRWGRPRRWWPRVATTPWPVSTA
jgi:aryl-alcohol dehydrogenase-like predicted oxidoreductase